MFFCRSPVLRFFCRFIFGPHFSAVFSGTNLDDGGSHAPIVEAVFGGPQVELLGPCGRGLALSGFCDTWWAVPTAFSGVFLLAKKRHYLPTRH